MTIKKVRKWLIRLLEDTEDELSEEDQFYLPHAADPEKPASLEELRDNHLYHQAVGMYRLHIRVGRLEAKVGLHLWLSFAILGLLAKPVVEPYLQDLMQGIF